MTYAPTLQSLNAHPVPEWFEDAKFGIFIHWGLFSIPAFASKSGSISDAFKTQYDIAVAIILIFVFLPRGWFHDEPAVGLSATAPGQVALVAGSEKSDRQTYRIDARVLAPPERTPALQNELHSALRKALYNRVGTASLEEDVERQRDGSADLSVGIQNDAVLIVVGISDGKGMA